ncbi:PhoD-like phosphatase-domain-containing protein [Pyrenochaeta sp. MPI-SDFR-AT-0127]|nr:PhoD-like phosphatase-domain-containing protein [Pyrenochaeta sp. MPI-SDFR-AT-0127]
MAFFLFAALSLASAATTSFDGNLNYYSPSRRHDGLGIDISKVAKRNLIKRGMPWDTSKLHFTHGVASVSGYADFYSHETEKHIKASPNPICVEYRVGTSAAFSSIVDDGIAYTTSDIDFTIEIEAKNLSPFKTYYYQFNVCGSSNKSPLGRTKTSPDHSDSVLEVGLAVFSCSNYPNGYFNAYGNAARKDNVDFFVHLGDYIYESGKGKQGKDQRATNPEKEIFSLYEVANNGYRDGFSGRNNTEASFMKSGGISVDSRKMNAVRSIRQVDMDDSLRIWRSFKMGKLFDLIMELQWAEGYYRGYFELHISPQELNARYYGSPSVAFRNPFEMNLENFTVKAGANHLERNVANGSVESGALQRGKTVPMNLTLNTQNGTWNVTAFQQMFITY